MQQNIPAFPTTHDISNLQDKITTEGMTLLDYFAARLLPKCTQKPMNIKQWAKWLFGYSYFSCTPDYKQVAANAYSQASAMLEESKKYIKQ